jgi:hypothetical protein
MEVKGTAVIAIRDFVKQNYPDDFNQWVDTLGVDAKTIFSSSIDSTKWYAMDSGAKEPTEKIGKMFFNGDIKRGAVEAGRYSAEKALTGIYKIFVKAANPQYIIKRASRVFSTYYRPCEMLVVRQSDKGVVSEISQLTGADDVIVNRIIGWCEVALEISGCQNVTITPQHVGDEVRGKVIELDKTWD